jgi:hypothetical protein
MARKPIVLLLAILVLGATGFAVTAAGPESVVVAIPAPTETSCSQAAGAADQMVPVARPERPQPEVLCIVEICKIKANKLYYCVVDVGGPGDCCHYGQQQCTQVSTCPAGVGTYCEGTNPGGVPPNACGGTC